MTQFIAKRFVLRGRVQQVGCRAQVQEIVESVGHLAGWVCNLNDGSVEVVLKGPDWRMHDVEEIFKTGMLPPVHLDNIEIELLPESFSVSGFEIRRLSKK